MSKSQEDVSYEGAGGKRNFPGLGIFMWRSTVDPRWISRCSLDCMHLIRELKLVSHGLTMQHLAKWPELKMPGREELWMSC